MKRTTGILLLILLFGLLLRILYLFFNTQTPYFAAPILDEFYYYQWAGEIAAGDWLASATVFRPPTYSYILAAILALAPNDFFFIVELLQHLAGLAGASLLYFLALRLFRNRTVAALSALIAVTYAPALFFEGQLLDTSLQVVLGPLVLMAALAAIRSYRRGTWFLFGLAGGLGAIVRPAALPFFLLFTVLSPWLLRRETPVAARGGRLALIMLMWLGIILPIAPLALRNRAVSGSFVPIASYAGINLWIGNNSHADGFTAKTPERYSSYGRYEDSVELFAKRRAEESTEQKLDAAQVQAFWLKAGLAEIGDSPGRFIKLCLKKLVLFWNRYEIRNNKSIYVYAQFHPLLRLLHGLFAFGFLIPLALYGVFRFLQRERMRSGAATYLLYVLTLMGGVILFFVNARYRFSAAYLMLPWSAYGIVFFVRILRNRFSRKKLWLSVGVVVIAFAWVNLDFYDISASENRSEDYWTVASCYAHKNMRDHALEYYRRALYHNADFTEAFNNMGEIYFHRKEYQKAASFFQKALSTAGNDRQALSRAFHNQGTVHSAMGNLEHAASAYGLAVEVEPRNSLAWIGLGNTWRKKQQWKQAYAAYETAARLNSLLPLAHLGLAHCWHAAGNEAKALEELKLVRAASKTNMADMLSTEPELARYLPMLVD